MERMCYFKGKVYIAGYGHNVAYSSDFSNWTTTSITPDNWVMQAGYGRLILLSGSTEYYTDDGTTWNSISVPLRYIRKCICTGIY